MDYLKINKKSWNERVAHHISGALYDMENFLKGANSLRDIEMAFLGNIEGKSILHLQCHFGQDTLSLEGLGAQVTGVDFSDVAIQKAEETLLSGVVQSDPGLIEFDFIPSGDFMEFDYVFASYGTINWLPDIEKWASIVSKFLKPTGQLIFAEFHPFIWMFDDDLNKIIYKYSDSRPILEVDTSTYGAKDIKAEFECVTWNHGIGDVINALIKNGLKIDDFQEYDYSPWDSFSNTIEFAPNKFHIKHVGNKIPYVYSILATKE